MLSHISSIQAPVEQTCSHMGRSIPTTRLGVEGNTWPTPEPRNSKRASAPMASSPAHDQGSFLHQSCFYQRPVIDRLEALFDPQMCEKLSAWNQTTMRDFELGLPRHQLNLCQPH